ncbi:hypothetical protein HK098_004206 [Nowakowskiella sp. JEL0407]|nr:hypothetical protein HK098_004206 [Nowakowskiella sp. JEL0407]
MLQNKINTRPADQPPVKVLAISDSEVWFVRFEDGSSTWSGIFDTIGWDFIQDSDQDVISVTFAPGGGYFVQFESGEGIYHSLPFGLSNLLANENRGRRKKHAKTPSIQLSERRPTLSVPQYDPFASAAMGAIVMAPQSRSVSFISVAPSIDSISAMEEEHLQKYKGRFISILAISGNGAWFLQFDDGVVAWDGLPSTLDKLLSSKLKKPNVYSVPKSETPKPRRNTMSVSTELREDEEENVVIIRKKRSVSLVQGTSVKLFAFSPATSGCIYVAFEDGTHFWISQDTGFQKVMKANAEKSIEFDEPLSPTSPSSSSKHDLPYFAPNSTILEDEVLVIPPSPPGSSHDESENSPASPQQQPPSTSKTNPSVRINLRVKAPAKPTARPVEFYRNHHLQRERLSFSALTAPPELAAKAMNGLAVLSKKPITVNPKKLLYTLDYITSNFENGQSIFLLFADLSRGVVSQDSVPPLRIFYDPRDEAEEEESELEDESEDNGTESTKNDDSHQDGMLSPPGDNDEAKSVVSHGSDSNDSRVTFGSGVTRGSSSVVAVKEEKRRMWCLDNKRLWVFRKIETIVSVQAVVCEAPPDFLQWCDQVDGTNVQVLM